MSSLSNSSCTTCKKAITSQVWKCKNSHFYCSLCLSQTCSQCGESLRTPSRDLATEDYLKSCEDLKCSFTQFGCEFRGRLVDYTHHLTTCEYMDRPLPCMIPGCEQSLRKKQMVFHLLNSHKTNLTSPSKVVDIVKGCFHIEVFRQCSSDEEWRNFERSPVVYRRLVGDEERFYLLRIWSEEWNLNIQMYSLTHDCEPIRYQLDTARAGGKSKITAICKTSNHSKSSPGFALPVVSALKYYSYIHERGDVRVLLFYVFMTSSDFFTLK